MNIFRSLLVEGMNIDMTEQVTPYDTTTAPVPSGQAEATPRPWKLIGKTIRGANGEFVGLLMDVSDESPTDADLAIRAVNSHDRLVEALENALNGMDAAHTDVQAEYARFPGPSLEAAEYNLRHAIADTTAALAAARGEGTA